MAEYIKREATIKRIEEVYCADCNSYNGVRCRACGTGDAIDMIEDAPAADVAPVVHARWIQVDATKCRCSHCDIIALIALYPHGDKNFCPNCGAMMDGGADHEDD